MQSGQKPQPKVQPAQPAKPAPPARATGASSFLVKGLLFLLVGLVLYSGLYAWSENLVYKNTELNRFYKIKTAESSNYDWVFFGASHALVMDLDDMNAQIEQVTGAKILNLGEMGGGVAVSSVLLDYYLANHETRGAVYFVDSFVFYSDFWNEGRLADVGLYQRAPFDLSLASVLLQNSMTRWKGLDYFFGFSKNNFWVTEKIKNSREFKSDVTLFPQSARFTRKHFPVPQVDRVRMEYLYGVVTGTHNGEANAVSLTDNTKDFRTLGVKVGSILTNVTDGSSTTITAIKTTVKPNDTLEGMLAGGAENDWDAGDAYVYPGTKVDQDVFQRYMKVFEDQLDLLKSKGARVVLIRPPLPDWVRNLAPTAAWKQILADKEAWFDGVLKDVAQKHGVELYDFSTSVPSKAPTQGQYWMDTDHLNQDGMLYFVQEAKASSGELLKDILKP